jgi:poly(3-hydroxybutyrate) depolymerase
LLPEYNCLWRHKIIDGTVQVGGMERTYYLHVPDSTVGNDPPPLVIVLHGAGGTGKQITAYSGFSRLADTARYWAKADGCRLEPQIVRTIDDNSGDGTNVIVSQYKADEQNDVWVYTIEGGGHTWPRTEAIDEAREFSSGFRNTLASRLGSGEDGAAGTINLGRTSHEFDAAEIIWQFFKSLRKF